MRYLYQWDQVMTLSNIKSNSEQGKKIVAETKRKFILSLQLMRSNNLDSIEGIILDNSGKVKSTITNGD